MFSGTCYRSRTAFVVVFVSASRPLTPTSIYTTPHAPASTAQRFSGPDPGDAWILASIRIRFVYCFYVYFVYKVYRRQHLCILRRRILAWCSIQSIRSIQYNGPCLGYHTVHARCCACSWCCACSICSRSKLSICQYIGSICHRMCQYFNFYICSKPLQYVSGALAGVGGSLLKQ